MPGLPLNLPPTGADVRTRIPADFLVSLGFGPPDGGPDPMDSFAQTAAGYVASTTGRLIDSSLVDQAPSSFLTDCLGANVASYSSGLDLPSIAWRAVILRVVQEATHESSDYMQATVSQDYLQSFKAGSYAEVRRSPETVLKSKGSVSNPPINPWAELSDLLWLLLTDQMFDYWMTRLGSPMPASVFVEQDFRDTWDAPGGLEGLPGFGAPGLGGSWVGGLGGHGG